MIKSTLTQLIALQAYANIDWLPQRKKANASLSSEHAGKRFGRGMDFAEFRHYQAGDDIRTIDWRVTARSNKPHVRIYREERERPVMILVDQSQSMQFGTQKKFKAVLAAEMAAILGWSALKNKDRVGGMIAGIEKEITLPPRSGKRGALYLLRALTQESQSAVTHWETILRDLRAHLKSSSVICLISDFQEFNLEAQQHIQQLAKYNDVLFVYISDPLEQVAPPEGKYMVTDGKQELLLDTTDKDFCEAYAKQFQQRFNETKTFCERHGIRFMAVRTDQANYG
jgi:uncharacterized protein (DUF58 family)